MDDIEKLGWFYLGRALDDPTDREASAPLLYDSRHLVTHAVCVGMTGSGKTGLCLALLEEAAIDGVPAIAIDPKGDLGNLLLTFPDLTPADFRPWIDESEISRTGKSADALAEAAAATWTKGLAEGGQDGARIARFKGAVETSIYTPGSGSGIRLSVLKSFGPPAGSLAADVDAWRDKLTATVSGLLALAGIESDPLRGREHILVANVLDRAWRDGRELPLGELIRQIQKPPFAQVGVVDLESFFPARERSDLAMALNGLLASPGFSAWIEGEPLDVKSLLYTPEGRPRLSILSIAHLSDAERMFFVTILLGEVLAWMRSQPGTGSLRALLYMDEVFGFFPPIANPPSKMPMLTLLKQARAFGLGIVLATQNPVDLDYKGLANAGTWFLGRLQTDRDKARVLDGLEGASASASRVFDRGRISGLLSSLDPRVFLLHDVHEEGPVLFRTRHTLSFLRGPLTRAQIQQLVAARRPAVDATTASAARPAAPSPTTSAAAGARPVLPAEISEQFLPPRNAGSIVYRPALLGVARLHFVDMRAAIDVWEDVSLLALLDAPSDDPWERGEEIDANLLSDAASTLEGARFAPLPPEAMRAKTYEAWRRKLADRLYRTRTLRLWRSAEPKLLSKTGESEGDFRARVLLARREERDAAVEKLRLAYAPKLVVAQDRIRAAEARAAREAEEYQQASVGAAVSIGATVLGALFGRKGLGVGTIGRASTAARSIGRASRQRAEIGRAAESVEAAVQRYREVESRLADELAAIASPGDDPPLEAVAIRPRKSDISVERVALVWTPWGGSDGTERAW